MLLNNPLLITEYSFPNKTKHLNNTDNYRHINIKKTLQTDYFSIGLLPKHAFFKFKEIKLHFLQTT